MEKIIDILKYIRFMINMNSWGYDPRYNSPNTISKYVYNARSSWHSYSDYDKEIRNLIRKSKISINENISVLINYCENEIKSKKSIELTELKETIENLIKWGSPLFKNGTIK